jgi:hypothetical protein
MGVSRRSYAAQRGVSEAAARKAVATKRITTVPEGRIDPTKADPEWGEQTDPAKRCAASRPLKPLSKSPRKRSRISADKRLPIE